MAASMRTLHVSHVRWSQTIVTAFDG